MSRLSGDSKGIVYDELVWAESPRWRDGTLWVSDTQGSRLLAVGPTEARVFELTAPVNGTGFLPTGELVGARMTQPWVDKFDGEGWELYADLRAVEASRLGDLLVLDDGTILVDDLGAAAGPGEGRLLRIDPSGSASVAAEDLTFPNGMAVIDGGTTLIVAETFANRLTAFTIDDRGDLSDRRLWLDLKGELGEEHCPDGIWPQGDGSVWAATGTGGAFVRAREGEVLERIDVDGFAIACCLGDGALYATAAQSLDPSKSVIEAVAEKKVRAWVERHPRDRSGPDGGGSTGE